MAGDQVISVAEAARIFKRITGRRRARGRIEADLHTFTHLGCFDHQKGAEPRLKGVWRGRWEYFVTIRFLLRGPFQVFSEHGPEGIEA